MITLFGKILELCTESAKAGISQNLAFMYCVPLRVDNMLGNTIPFGLIDLAIMGMLFPEFYSLIYVFAIVIALQPRI